MLDFIWSKGERGVDDELMAVTGVLGVLGDTADDFGLGRGLCR